jgi:tRNA-dihydrouridine synthase
MIGRGAMWNPSIFCAEKAVAPETVVHDFFDACLKYNEPKPSVKWSLAQMMEGTTALWGRPMKEIRDLIHQAKTLDDLQNAIKPPLEALPVDLGLDRRPKRIRIEDI